MDNQMQPAPQDLHSADRVAQNAAHRDPDGRILDDFEALLAVTQDERFVTARHTLQAIWRVGLGGPAQRARVIDGLSHRYRSSFDDKNGTLIRYDIAVALRQLDDATGDETIREPAAALIASEPDPNTGARTRRPGRSERRTTNDE